MRSDAALYDPIVPKQSKMYSDNYFSGLTTIRIPG
jgi:hypothetical protein